MNTETAFKALRGCPSAGERLIFWRNKDPRCPHCAESIDIDRHELWRLYEEGEHDMECPHCEGEFVVSTNITYSFSTDEQEQPE